jgi:dephospho-CoA kinase
LSPPAHGPVETWGLTGGIASGKSLAARFFEEAGVPVVDADRIARELSQPGGPAHPLLLARFGTADRAALRGIVFGDPEARRALEGILHPLIQVRSREEMDRAALRSRSGRVLYEASLLIETGRYREFQGLIVVEAPLELRKARLLARDPAQAEMVDQILAAQISDAERRAAATELLVNSGTEEELRTQVLALVSRRGWKS